MKGRDLGRVREVGGGKETGDGGKEGRLERGETDGSTAEIKEEAGKRNRETRKREESRGNVAIGRKGNKI